MPYILTTFYDTTSFIFSQANIISIVSFTTQTAKYPIILLSSIKATNKSHFKGIEPVMGHLRGTLVIAAKGIEEVLQLFLGVCASQA